MLYDSGTASLTGCRKGRPEARPGWTRGLCACPNCQQ